MRLPLSASALRCSLYGLTQHRSHLALGAVLGKRLHKPDVFNGQLSMRANEGVPLVAFLPVVYAIKTVLGRQVVRPLIRTYVPAQQVRAAVSSRNPKKSRHTKL